MTRKIAVGRRILGAMLAVAAAGQARGATPQHAVCTDTAGSVLFTDMLYGIGAGALLTGLYLAATDDRDHPGNKVALGAFSLGTVGLGVGALELALRDCGAPAAAVSARPGWQRPTVGTTAGGPVVGLAYVLP